MNRFLRTIVQMHKRIVEVLAMTVNGCLAELGYFPGTVQKLEQLENEILRLQDEKARMYNDNRLLEQSYIAA